MLLGCIEAFQGSLPQSVAVCDITSYELNTWDFQLRLSHPSGTQAARYMQNTELLLTNTFDHI